MEVGVFILLIRLVIVMIVVMYGNMSRNCEGIGVLIVDSLVDSWVMKLKNSVMMVVKFGC